MRLWIFKARRRKDRIWSLAGASEALADARSAAGALPASRMFVDVEVMMPYWIFKLAEQELYPDIPGEQYVYDNTHSVRVRAEDTFIYLDKREGYAFSGTGCVRKVTERKPTKAEASRTAKVRTVFTAHLADVIWFAKPLSISSLTRAGRKNRAKLGIENVNLLGWSQSMPRLSSSMYEAIMSVIQMEGLMPVAPERKGRAGHFIDDSWGTTKVRKAPSRFTEDVVLRHRGTCVVCGTRLHEVIEVAHLSPYAIDKENRANPENGVCLCAFCHRALDRRLIAIRPSGELLVSRALNDPVARQHFNRVPATRRRRWLRGVNPEFLEVTCQLLNNSS